MDLLDVCAVVYSRLSSDGSLTALVGDRIYPDEAPPLGPGEKDDDQYPLVTYGVHTSPPDVLGGGAEAVMAKPLIRVSVHGKNVDATELRSAWDRVKTALTSLDPITEGETRVLGFYLEQRLPPMSLHTGAVRYASTGGLFRFYCEPA